MLNTMHTDNKIGMTRFDSAASGTQNKCTTKLCYIPMDICCNPHH